MLAVINSPMFEWGYLYGVSLGIFIAVSTIMLMYGLSAFFLRKKTHAAMLFLYGGVSTLCFAFFDIFVLTAHAPETAQYFPSWLLYIGKIGMPLGICCNFQMIMQSIPIRSLSAFLAWQRIRKYFVHFYMLAGLSFIALVGFVESAKYASAISFILIVVNNIFSLLIASSALKHAVVFSRIHNSIILGVLLSSLITFSLCFNSDLSGIPEFLFVLFHLFFALLVLGYTFMIFRFIIRESMPYENISKYNIDGFYKNIYHALENDEFYVEYQPKIALSSQQPCGIEALIRWEHPENGLIPPSDFIPMAEQTGIIDNICQWVLERVAVDIVKLRTQGIELPVSINFSVNNMHMDTVEYLQEILQRYQLPAESVIIEITETLFLGLSDEQKEVLDALQDMNIKLSLDDFGAGFSSLRYLDEMHLSEVKIDKILTDKILETEQNTVVASIITMCQALNISVVAEGINDEKTMQALIEMNCEIGQGFLFCHPKKLQDLQVWLADQQS